VTEENRNTVKNVLMLTWEYPPHIIGGLSRHVQALSAELAKSHHEIHVLTAGPLGTESYEKIDRVHIHRVSPLNAEDPDFLAWIGGLNLAAVNYALTLTDHIDFDFIHNHDWMTGAAAEFLSNTLEIPLISTIHGTEFGRNEGIFTDLQQFIFDKERELARASAQVIVCSEYMKNEVMGLFGISGSKIVVISNGSLTESSPSKTIQANEAFPFLKEKKVIFSIGRIVKEKGFGTLIKAAAILKESFPDLCFVIAGNGPLLENCRQLTQQLGLTDYVYFLGFVQEGVRNSLLERADIAVFASTYEPFGLAAAEALAAGVPTIIAETGGMKGLAEHLKTGFVIKPGNEGSLAEMIAFILKNEMLAKQIAEKGRKSVTSKFSWEENAKSTARTYEKQITEGVSH
jgi:glycogen synthase